MRTIAVVPGAWIFSGGMMRAAPPQITDPVSFVTEVYRQFVRGESAGKAYEAPDAIYSPRLKGLLADDKAESKGEIGCLDFVFWVNGQDWTLTDVAVTTGAERKGEKAVIARFRNGGMSQEIHFDFRAVSGNWLLEDVRSVRDPRWTLSELLKCRH